MKRKVFWGLAILFSLLNLLPLLTTGGRIFGDDVAFHLNRLIGLGTIWQSPVSFESFSGIGLGVNYFYPYLSVYPLYLLYALTGSLYWAYLVFYFLLNVLTFWLADLSARGVARLNGHGAISGRLGLAFAILYQFSLYRFINGSVRLALGEFVAMAVLPLIFYGFWEILKGNYRKWYLLSLGMTALVYSHLLSVYLTSVFLGLILLLGLGFTDQRWQRLGYLAMAALACVVMSAFQLFPMLEQFLAHPIGSVNTFDINTYTQPLEVLLSVGFLTGRSTLGTLVILTLLISLFFVRRYSYFDWVIWGFLLVFILLESKTIHYPTPAPSWLALIQFPWRFSLYITLLSAYLLAEQLAQWRWSRRSLLVLAGVTLVVSLTIGTLTLQSNLADGRDGVNILPASGNSRALLTSPMINYDYSFTTGNKERDMENLVTRLEHRVFEGDTGQELVSRYQVDGAWLRLTLTNDTDANLSVELPVSPYQGQQVYVNNQRTSSHLGPHQGTVVQLAPGLNQVRVTYGYTALTILSGFISLLGGLLTLVYALLDQIRRSRTKRRQEWPAPINYC